MKRVQSIFALFRVSSYFSRVSCVLHVFCALLTFCELSVASFTKTTISRLEIIVEAIVCSCGLSRNALHDLLPENSGK